MLIVATSFYHTAVFHCTHKYPVETTNSHTPNSVCFPSQFQVQCTQTGDMQLLCDIQLAASGSNGLHSIHIECRPDATRKRISEYETVNS